MTLPLTLISPHINSMNVAPTAEGSPSVCMRTPFWLFNSFAFVKVTESKWVGGGFYFCYRCWNVLYFLEFQRFALEEPWTMTSANISDKHTHLRVWSFEKQQKSCRFSYSFDWLFLLAGASTLSRVTPISGQRNFSFENLLTHLHIQKICSNISIRPGGEDGWKVSCMSGDILHISSQLF